MTRAQLIQCPMAWTWCDQGWLPASYPVYAALCLLSLVVGQDVSRKQTMPPLVDGEPFQVYWNLPTSRCSSHRGVDLQLADFGIVHNANEIFTGEKITLFYNQRFGIYPFYEGDDPMNGGFPQNASLQEHLRQAKVDIEHFLPAGFEGLVVIDWEEWRPLYVRNWGSKRVYQRKSQERVRERHPDWNRTQINAEAKKEFDQAARNFMNSSLSLGKSLRPQGYWGFYLFPDCYNYHFRAEFPTYNGHCPDIDKERNNELTWLWTESTALFPSVYLEEKLNSELGDRGKLYARYRIQEAVRVSLLTKQQYTPPIFLYSRAHYSDGDTRTPLNEVDLIRTLGESAAMGASGAILWGSSIFARSTENCQALKDQVHNVLGPYILNLTAAVRFCSRTLCSNHGRCYRRNAEEDVFLHLNSRSFRIMKGKWRSGKVHVRGRPRVADRRDFRDNFQCQCYRGWNGTRCSRFRMPSASCRAETSPLTLVLVLLLSLLLI